MIISTYNNFTQLYYTIQCLFQCIFLYLISEFQANSNKSILKDALLTSDFEDDLLQQENVDEKGKMCPYHL